MATQIISRNDGSKFHGLCDDNQGFVDQYGNYMTRKEAFNIAVAANQIINMSVGLGDILYSEALY